MSNVRGDVLAKCWVEPYDVPRAKRNRPRNIIWFNPLLDLRHAAAIYTLLCEHINQY